jgi:hypothetical protein
MMFFDGYIAAPPTITDFCANDAVPNITENVKNAADNKLDAFIKYIFFKVISSFTAIH